MKNNRGNSIISIILSILILILICLIGYEIIYVDIFEIMGEESSTQNMESNNHIEKNYNKIQNSQIVGNTTITEPIIDNSNLRGK